MNLLSSYIAKRVINEANILSKWANICAKWSPKGIQNQCIVGAVWRPLQAQGRSANRDRWGGILKRRSSGKSWKWHQKPAEMQAKWNQNGPRHPKIHNKSCFFHNSVFVSKITPKLCKSHPSTDHLFGTTSQKNPENWSRLWTFLNVSGTVAEIWRYW